jgi:hypothetical protein
MFHRHVTLERYELALEEDPDGAAAIEAAARRCLVCQRALSQPSLRESLASWRLPVDVEAPVDWRRALRRAVAPSMQPAAQRRFQRWGIVAALAVIASLGMATAPVAAAAGPGSPLYGVRGVEEDARWRLTPESDRPNLEADLALAYLWDARVSTGRGDTAAYLASIGRFFQWAGRLKSDVRKAPTSRRLEVQQDVRVARSLVESMGATGSDPSSSPQRADSVLKDVQGQSQEGNGEHQGSQPGVGQGSGGSSGPAHPAPSQTPGDAGEAGSSGAQGQSQEGNGTFPGQGWASGR